MNENFNNEDGNRQSNGFEENQGGESNRLELKALVTRWIIYSLIILSSSVAASIRISNVNAVSSEIRMKKDIAGTPLLCANDRSRWSTIRALGDLNVYEIDSIISDPKTGEFSLEPDGRRNRYWATIDLVKHVDENGEMHFYSSKPTLFPTLLAYLYKGIKVATGKDLESNTFFVVRLMLIIVNVIPMAILLVLLAIILELVSEESFTKIMLLIAASFGTFLTPFTITLNNHSPAAFSVAVTLFALFHILKNRNGLGLHFFIAGIFSAFAAANELPALSFFCFIGFVLLLQNWAKTLLLFVPGAILVIAPFFWTNKLAHDDWIPPYVHRNDGSVIATLDEEVFNAVRQLNVSKELVAILDEHEEEIGFLVSEKSATIAEGQMPLGKMTTERYVLTQTDDSQRLAIVKQTDGRYEIRKWNNWYDYPESQWLLGKKQGVDKGEPDAGVYALHCLIGHHGIFSLTPVWIFSLCGFPLLFSGRMKRFSWFGVMVIVISIVVVGFYLSRPLEDRNYGGGTSALRWLLWLAPMWIIAAVPFVDLISRSIWGKIVVVLLIAGSIASAHYSAMNPWVHPWFYELMLQWKWIKPF